MVGFLSLGCTVKKKVSAPAEELPLICDLADTDKNSDSELKEYAKKMPKYCVL